MSNARLTKEEIDKLYKRTKKEDEYVQTLPDNTPDRYISLLQHKRTVNTTMNLLLTIIDMQEEIDALRKGNDKS